LKIRLSKIQEIEEINSAYEGTKNENNKLRQLIFDNQKKADQQQRNQSHMNDELKRRYIKLTQIFLTHLNQVVILSPF
jgi:Skp family chaperone for outer membrane proteins